MATVQVIPYLENCQSNKVVILLTSSKSFIVLGAQALLGSVYYIYAFLTDGCKARNPSMA